MAFCDDITTTCGDCYEQIISTQTFSFSTGRAQGENVYVSIIDKFNKYHTNLYTLGANGLLTLTLTNYPTAFFSEFGGKYELFLHANQNVFTRLNLTISTVTYTCILFTVASGIYNCDVPTPVVETSDVNVNGVLFDTVECGETINVPVVDTNGDPVGSIVAGEVVVECSGGDATITINSAAYGTAPAGQTTNIIVENTASTQIGSKVGANWRVADTTATAKNSANTTIGTATQIAGVATTVTVADITKTDSDGTTSSVPAGVNVTCTPQVKGVFIKVWFPIGITQTETVTIDSDSAGTYTSISDDGASGTITVSKNGAAFGAFSNPTSFIATDTLAIKRTTVTATGWVKITGTYV